MKLLSVKFDVFYQLVALAEGNGLDGAMRCLAKGRRPRISITCLRQGLACKLLPSPAYYNVIANTAATLLTNGRRSSGHR
jgi:hypothetical protein